MEMASLSQISYRHAVQYKKPVATWPPMRVYCLNCSLSYDKDNKYSTRLQSLAWPSWCDDQLTLTIQLHTQTSTPDATIAWLHAHGLLSRGMLCDCSQAMVEAYYQRAVDDRVWRSGVQTDEKYSTWEFFLTIVSDTCCSKKLLVHGESYFFSNILVCRISCYLLL